MPVRAYLRSPAALGWTLLGVLATGVVLGAGWAGVLAIRASGVGGTTLATGGIADLLYLVLLVAVGAVLSVVWTPIAGGIAYAMGRQARGDRASVRRSASAVRTSGRPLLRWLKTRLTPGPFADRLLTEDDVASTEVAAGCEKFVVPALLLDAPGDLRRAVDNANRVTPRPGHGRILAAGVAVTGLLAAGAFFGSGAAPAPVATVTIPLTVAVVVIGLAVTAAVGVAWRASVYATADLSDGFLR
jgi:hypothetical protein